MSKNLNEMLDEFFSSEPLEDIFSPDLISENGNLDLDEDDPEKLKQELKTEAPKITDFISDLDPDFDAVANYEIAKGSKIGQYLVSKGYISESQLQAALEEQRVNKEKLGLILTRDGFISRKMLLEAILATNPDFIHGESLYTAKVPEEVLIQNQTMIVAETPQNLFLATMANEAQSEIDLKPYFPDKNFVFVAANIEQIDDYLEEIKAMHTDQDSLMDKILKRAFSENASDIHIVPRYNTYTILFRVLGVRKIVHEGRLDEYNILTARIKDLARLDLAERRVPQDGGFQKEYNGKLVDLRVATLPSNNLEYVVIRLLDPDRVHPSLEGLGITHIDKWRMGASRSDGLCLICGPTGSGKTTTLNASIKELNRFERAVYTLEEPVEYRIAYVGQVNTNPSVGLDFSRGVRAFMRADPDVIVIGEIRDPDTARNAIKAAETGHLVFGTLHTNNIRSAVNRLRDLDIAPNELSYLLRSVLVQRLMRVYCLDCKGSGKNKNGHICVSCGGTGYGSRTIVSECEYFSQETDIQRLLRGEEWWPTILDDAFLKYKQGLTSSKELIRVFGEEAIRKIKEDETGRS